MKLSLKRNKRVIRDYYKHLHANKRNVQILEKNNLPRLNQEKIENMKRQISWTETLITNLPINKSPGTVGLTGNFYEKFREDLMPTQLKLLKKISEGGKLPNSSY